MEKIIHRFLPMKNGRVHNFSRCHSDKGSMQPCSKWLQPTRSSRMDESIWNPISSSLSPIQMEKKSIPSQLRYVEYSRKKHRESSLPCSSMEYEMVLRKKDESQDIPSLEKPVPLKSHTNEVTRIVFSDKMSVILSLLMEDMHQPIIPNLSSSSRSTVRVRINTQKILHQRSLQKSQNISSNTTKSPKMEASKKIENMLL